MKIFLLITAFLAVSFIKTLAFWSDSRTYFFGDTAIFSLQLASLAKNLGTILSAKDSVLLWNPNYLSVGLPALSVIDYGLVYPANILIAAIAHFANQPFLVFPLYEISLLLHLVFGTYFIYKILRKVWKLGEYPSLVGSLIWSYNGFNVEWLGAGPIFISASYLPVCLYLTLRRIETEKKIYSYLFYLCLGLSFLIGYPMVSLLVYASCLTLSFTLTRTGSVHWFINFLKEHTIGFLLITLPIIAPLYFVSLTNLVYTVRSQLKLDSFLQNPIPLLNLTEPFLPKNTLFNTLNRINSVYLYLSLVGTLILLQSEAFGRLLKDKKNRLLFLIGLGGLIFSLGSTAFLPSIAYFMLPGVNLFRRLSVFAIIPNTVFAIFVGQLVAAALSKKAFAKSIIFWIKLLVILLIYTQVLNILYSSQPENPFNQPFLYQSLFLSILITGVTLVSFFYHRTSANLGRGLLLLALLIESGTAIGSKFYINSKIDPAQIFQPNSLTNSLSRLLKPMERVDLLATQQSYSTDYLGFEQTQGYLSLASQYGAEINEALTAADYDKKNLRELLGVRYVVRKNKDQEEGLQKISTFNQDLKKPEFFAYNYRNGAWEAEDPNLVRYTIFENPKTLPRLFLAKEIGTTVTQSKDEIKIIETLNSPKSLIINEKDLRNVPISDSGKIEIKEYKRNYLKAQVENETDVFLANTTAFYPGWQAKINSRVVKPLQVDWFMMGIYLPPGSNSVEFLYRPTALAYGLAYFIVALIFWMGYFVKFFIFKKNHGKVRS